MSGPAKAALEFKMTYCEEFGMHVSVVFQEDARFSSETHLGASGALLLLGNQYEAVQLY